MPRMLWSVALAALVAWNLPAADDAVELKNHKPKVGDRQRVTDDDRSTTRSVIRSDDNVDEKIEKRAKLVVYVSEVLAVKEGEKKATKVRRVYEKAEETKEGETRKLPLHGKTVVIEKKGDAYGFTYDDGKAVDGAARETLDKEFNKKDEDAVEDFIPRRPLKPGESWKMDTDKLLKSMVKDTFVPEKKGASATGKLAEVYTFDGKKYGVFEMAMDFPLAELRAAKNTPLKPGSKLTIRITGDGNVDGSAPDGTLTTRLSLRASFDLPNGAEVSIRADGFIVRTIERLPPRMRD